MFFLYSLTVLYYKTCSVYSECFFLYSCTVFYFIMIYQQLVIAKNVFVYVPRNKKFRKSCPGYSTVPDSKINNSME